MVARIKSPDLFGTVLPERMHRQNHRKTARNEKCGIQRTEKTGELPRPGVKINGVFEPVHGIEKKKPAEKQDFGGDKKPHPDPAAGTLFNFHAHCSAFMPVKS